MATADSKCCTTCGVIKQVSDFYWRKDRGHAGVCKQCTDAGHRAYVAAHAAKVSDYKKRWQAENAERVSKHKSAKYAVDGPAKAAKLAAAIAWAANNPERRSAIAQNYKHRRRAQEQGGITSGELMAWKKAQPKVCYWCGKKCAPTVDHYMPLSKGGPHEVENLVIACRPCNTKKNSKDPEQFRALSWPGSLFGLAV